MRAISPLEKESMKIDGRRRLVEITSSPPSGVGNWFSPWVEAGVSSRKAT